MTSEAEPARFGWFITIEGPEGAGKTSQAEILRSWLAEDGWAVRLVREPGGTPVGERIRELLLATETVRLTAEADALLFNAARAELVAEVIRPALDRGEIVISARFADSTLAYQGFGGGLPLHELRALEVFATAGLRPDVTILLDLPAELGLARKAEHEVTRFEAGFDLAFHRRVRAGFLTLAEAEPDRFVIVDASAQSDLVASAIRRVVNERLRGEIPTTRAKRPLRVVAGPGEPGRPSVRTTR